MYGVFSSVHPANMVVIQGINLGYGASVRLEKLKFHPGSGHISDLLGETSENNDQLRNPGSKFLISYLLYIYIYIYIYIYYIYICIIHIFLLQPPTVYNFWHKSATMVQHWSHKVFTEFLPPPVSGAFRPLTGPWRAFQGLNREYAKQINSREKTVLENLRLTN